MCFLSMLPIRLYFLPVSEGRESFVITSGELMSKRSGGRTTDMETELAGPKQEGKK